ncbi:MAG: tagaturonate epimerase family protein [Caldilinea sp.]|nr:tagaturonate epimerase family protein [Caldilinea sp.]MDW8442330.1 tagaturonate epimerase family protein [Caldilineaceae bacterium]
MSVTSLSMHILRVVRAGDAVYTLVRSSTDATYRLFVRGNSAAFRGERQDDTLICPLDAENARALQERLPWLRPQPLGSRLSFGFGDRIGLATPGHIDALRSVDPAGRIAPIFAQQSVRENERLRRTPEEVMTAAIWSLFAEDWRLPWGADADHVKEPEHVAPFVAAGYTFFTVDPSDYVDNGAQTDNLTVLHMKCEALPWDVLETTYSSLYEKYHGRTIALDGEALHFDEETLLRSLAKYGRALAHTVRIAAALRTAFGGTPFDLEMSVDETDTPTSAHEHFFIANELLRRNIPLVSLAPRFVGKFQKGVDYMGNLAEFEAELTRHVAVMRYFNRYKLSVHTGSDKFSIYPILARRAGHGVHIKTAGTSYLEALRVAAVRAPDLFRQMLETGRTHYEKDKKTYFLDCRPERVPPASSLAAADLPALLDQFDARQLLHVTFGSILTAHGADLRNLLTQYLDDYRSALCCHFARHLEPFVKM